MDASKVKLCDVKIDYDLYPRNDIDTRHVHYMAESLEMGAVFPPVVLDRRSLRVVDGVHRVRMYRKCLDEDALIDAVLKTYKSEAAIFSEAMELNARHGAKLDRHDRVHCAHRANELGIPMKKVARILQMDYKKFVDLVDRRTATIEERQKKNGGAPIKKKRKKKPPPELIPLKRTIEHMGGHVLTERQVAANARLSGMDQKFYALQLIELLEADLVDTEDANLLAILAKLNDLLGTFLAAHGG